MELDDTRQINEDMNLDEAREIARVWRAGETTPRYFPFVQYALLILDDRIIELEAQRDELVEVCKKAAARQPQALKYMRKHHVVIDDLGNKYQQTAFAFYNMLVFTATDIEGVLDNQSIIAAEKAEASDNTTDVRRKPDRIDYGTGG